MRSYEKQIAINKQNFLQKAMHTVVRKQLLSLPEYTIGKYINFKKDYFEGIKPSKSTETVTRIHMHTVVIQHNLTEEHFFLLISEVVYLNLSQAARSLLNYHKQYRWAIADFNHIQVI